MKFRPFLVPVILLTAFGGLVGWLLLVEPPKVPDTTRQPVANTAPSGPETSQPPSDLLAGAAQLRLDDPTAPAPLPDRIRDVSPDGVSAPKVEGGLKRIEPSERYLELKNPPVLPATEKPLEFARAHVVDSGNLRVNKLELKLAHIHPLAADATCTTETGTPWPCGARARTFMRGIIRQFKISCQKVEELGPKQILATCAKGNMDLSTQLVRFGWAEPTADAPDEFVELAAAAKERKLGKWKAEWLTDIKVSDWENKSAAPLPGLKDLQPEPVDWSRSAASHRATDP